MTRTILMKYGELILKGANKRSFEALLCNRIKARMKKLLGENGFEFECMQSTLYVTPKDDTMVEAAYDNLKKIFGIVSVCISYRAEKNIEDIVKVALDNIPKHIKGFNSFKVDARRSDKAFPLTSPEIMSIVGGELSEVCPEIKVDVRQPDIVVRVEIREKYAYIHAGAEHGAGGMPYLSNGKGLLLLSGGIDSPVAGYMMAKRGVEIDAIHFESFPYTSERAKEKVIALAKCLTEYTDKVRIHFISLTEIQEAIRDNCDEDYFTLILRRFMMPIAETVARRYGAEALITGESIGQVASQTMSALAVTDCTVNIPVFRPCIGMDKEEIVQIARKIDTFETSILPYEDCCTVFTPRHPRTKPILEKVEKAERNLDRQALIERALATETELLVYND